MKTPMSGRDRVCHTALHICGSIHCVTSSLYRGPVNMASPVVDQAQGPRPYHVASHSEVGVGTHWGIQCGRQLEKLIICFYLLLLLSILEIKKNKNMFILCIYVCCMHTS